MDTKARVNEEGRKVRSWSYRRNRQKLPWLLLMAQAQVAMIAGGGKTSVQLPWAPGVRSLGLVGNATPHLATRLQMTED